VLFRWVGKELELEFVFVHVACSVSTPPYPAASPPLRVNRRATWAILPARPRDGVLDPTTAIRKGPDACVTSTAA